MRKICSFLFRMIRKCRSLIYTFLLKHMTGNADAEGLKVDGFVDCKVKKITFGKNVRIYNNVVFWGDGEIVIGDNVQIGYNTIIFASENGGVEIGNDVNIAANCYIIDMNHGTAANQKVSAQANDCEKIAIGNDVWIAASTTVLKGSQIPDGVVIGANSVVNKPLEPYCIYAGSPAKKIKEREE